MCRCCFRATSERHGDEAVFLMRDGHLVNLAVVETRVAIEAAEGEFFK